MKSYLRSLAIVSVAWLLLGQREAAAARGPDITIVLNPVSISVIAGAPVTFTVVASAPGNLTYQWSHAGKPIAGATDPSLVVKAAQLSDAGDYVVTITKGGRSVDTTPAILTVDGLSVSDTSGPEVTLQTPSGAFTRTVNPVYTLQGQAKDTAGIALLCVQVDSASCTSSVANQQWSLDASLRPGTNHVAISAIDLLGNASATQTVVLFYSVTQALSLQIAGAGSVSGAQEGQGLEIGRYYSLTATPAVGNRFKCWRVNGRPSSAPSLSFFMWSNVVVQAEFHTNTFLALQGGHAGLFYDTNSPGHDDAGLLTCTVNGSGKVSGRLLRAGETLPFSGRFNPNLHASITLARPPPATPLALELDLEDGTDRLSGSVSDGSSVAVLEGYRAPFSTARPAINHAGKYTLAVSGSADPALSPFGHGVGLITISPAGAVAFAGTLADGSVVAEKVALAANGQWPLYIPLYRGKGSIFGWVTMSETATNDIRGLLYWTKSAGVAGLLHTNGFTTYATLAGSRYTAPAPGQAAVGFSNAVLSLGGGNLAAALDAEAWVNSDNTVTVLSPNANRLAVRMAKPSGLVSGSFVHPQTLRTTPIKGVVLQKQNVAAGFFLGTNQSGGVTLHAPGAPLGFDPAP